MLSLLIAIFLALADLGICGAALGFMIGSLFTLSPHVLNLAASAGAASLTIGGLSAAIVRQARGGTPLYAGGLFHGYVLGIPEMDFGCLTMLLCLGFLVISPLLQRPGAIHLVRWLAIFLVIVASAAALRTIVKRRPRRP